MKKRLLSFALAVTMLFGSVNVAFADETSVPEADPVVAEEVTPVADDTASDGAVEDPTETTTEATESTGPDWATTSPWQATVFGDVGGQPRIDNYGDLTSTDAYPNQDGVYVYNVEELGGNSVNVRMGIPNYSNSADTAVSQGKIASGSDGIVYYYQQIAEDEDFTLSATAHVNGICNTNNQVSFGATVRDTVMPLDASDEAKMCGDSISAAALDMNQFASAKEGESLKFAYYRQGGALTKFASTADKKPDIGDDIEVSITKVGSNYTLKFGDEVTVVNADEAGISLTDDVYVGFFASRCADITFSNVKYDNGGEVEIGEWTAGGNGFVGNSDKIPYVVSSTNADNSELRLTLDVEKNGEGLGKLSSDEDSYGYYAVQAPAGEDFTLSSTIDELTLSPNMASGLTSNPHQAGVGFILFNNTYTREEGAPDFSKTGNHLFIGLTAANGSDTTPDLVYRYRANNAFSVTKGVLKSDAATIGANAGPIEFSISRSGDLFKVTFGDETFDLPAEVNASTICPDNQYIGYMVARDGVISVSDNTLTVGSRSVSSVEVESMPEKTEYYATQSFDPTGLSFKVTYDDGGEEIISDPSGYSLIGFDDASNQSFNTVGDKIVQASIGGIICEIPITVRPMKVTSISVDYTPIYDTFYVGGKFNFTGLQVSAEFEDGTAKVLKSEEYALYIGDTLIDPSKTTITEDMVAPDVAVTVMYNSSEDASIDPNNATGVFYITIDPGKLVGLELASKSFKTTYYIGDDFDPSGLTVQGIYKNGDKVSYQLMSSEFYEVVGFNSESVNDALELKVQYKDDPSIYTTFTIKVEEAIPVEISVLTYPRLTFSVNEAFDAKRLTIGILYSDTRVKNLSDEVIFYKNGAEYYKIYSHDVKDSDGNVSFTSGQRVDITEAELNAADYYVDLTNYDNSVAGTTTVVTICANVDKYNVPDLDLDVSIIESTDHVWKATIFGASSLGVNEQGIGSHIIANYKDGSSQRTDGSESGISAELMENGKLTNIDSIDMVSWDKAGKITGSIDGITYYYTKVNPNNNFTISADITVNRYVNDPSTFTGTNLETYQSYLAQGYSPDVALDMMREGQEAFGIMARDVVPFAGGMVDGKYKGNSNNTTLLESEAYKKDYTFTKSDGSTVTYNLPVDTLEAMNEGISVVDENGVTHTLDKKKVAAEISSNMVAAGGATDGSWPKDPSSSTYTKKTQQNRINLMARYNSERFGYYTTTSKLPEAGETYNITLSKTNTGFMITTYDYQTGLTATQYMYNDAEGMVNPLTTQDQNNIYVGFYTARWADISVSNIELNETLTATDPILSGTVEEKSTPRLTISSPYYTTYSNYPLEMKANSTKGVPGGYATISLNGKTEYKDVIIDDAKKTFPVTLKEDAENYFSVVYYPNTADTNFSSYDPVITRFTVTHKSLSELNDSKKIYIAPNGTLSGDGTRNNPLTLEAALALVDAGGEVIMLDGTYNLTNEYLGDIELTNMYSGTANGYYKSLVADEGANPVIDLEKEYAGFSVDADYWYFKGFSVINSRDNSNGFVLGGDHCVVENCTFVNNGDTGLQISRVNSDDNSIYYWPSYNLIKGCESYNNCDPSQNNADGFAAKLTVGYGNMFQDCISHHNVDDGWDLYTKTETGAIGAIVIENSITYKNGYQLDEETGTDSLYNSPEGNGFKLGGESIYVEHMIKDSIAFNNYNAGVNSNNNPALIVRNVISYNNNSNFTLKSGSTAILTDSTGNNKDTAGRNYKFNYDIKGAVSYGSTDSIGSWNDDMIFGNISATPIDSETNYLAKTGTVGVNSLGEAVDPSTFFVSTDQSTSLNESMRYNRNADGSFNHGDFLARSEEYAYEHDAADIVTPPDVLGGKGGVGLGVTTETTTDTEVTTEAPRRGSSGAGGGGSVKNYVATTTTEGTTSEVVEEDTTEATTEAVVFTDSVAVQVGSKDIKVNDSTYTMDVAPYIQTSSNSTMVPLRFVSIALAGGSVASADSSDLIVWDAATKTATITAGSDTIVFTAGSGTYTVNGSTLNISNQAVAEIVDGRMFVPFRTIGEALGAEVSWDADTKTAMYN